MRHITEHTPAASRAASAARLAILAGVALLAGLAVAATGTSAGIVVAIASLLVLLLAYRRHLDAAELAAIGARPVVEVARPAPTLAGQLSGPALMNRLAEHPDASHWLVSSPHGWLVASSLVLMDTALATDGTIQVRHLGRRVRAVDGSMPVDRLPRVPLQDEVWLVEGGSEPRLLSHQDLLDAEVQASGTATAGVVVLPGANPEVTA